MSSATHRIRKQRWLITARNSAQAFSLRKKVQDEWGSLIEPMLEKAFDELAPNGEIIKIDKLEIALHLHPETLEKKPELIQQEIFQQVREQLEPLIRSKDINATTSIERTDDRQFRYQQLIRYLSNGSLSWESSGLSNYEIISNFRQVIVENPEALLVHLGNNNPGTAFIFRLLQLSSDETELDYLKPLFHANWSKEFVSFMQSLISHGDSSHLFDRLKVASSVMEQAIRSRDNHLLPDFSIPLSQSLTVHGESLIAYLKMLPLSDVFLPGREEKIPVMPATADASMNLNPDDNGGEQSEKLAVDDASLPEDSKTGDGFLVTNAGLILLHPFMEQLFRARGILEAGEKNIAPGKLAKAAAILHFAVTGSTGVYEFELGLIKVLLGLDPSDELTVAVGLLDSEDCSEVESMLGAFISHWAAIKNTSVNGLRESFLQRSGLLSWKDEQWTLNVERKSYDMLLDMLPWTISIVKLPWMQKPIFTEW
ncbi:MAG: hypothetical protein HXX13_17475 [Bacteroidetes bacterium]|nr:hypothetical protein [Bacteroidota bacterium]